MLLNRLPSSMKQIRKLRELRNYTQKFMAEKLGMSQSNYARLESGAIRMEKEHLSRIAKILNVSQETLASFNEHDFLDKMGGKKITDHRPANTFNSDKLISKIHAMYKDKIQLMEKRILFLESLVVTLQKHNHTPRGKAKSK